MFNNFLNSIPVVGHAKGCFHYITGDRHEARKAFYQSTRSSVVVAATMVAGPVGTVGAAALAGAGMDTVTSVCTRKPQGVIAGVDNIITQASNGEFPIKALIETGVMVGGDMLCGVGGGQIANNVGGAISSSTKHLGQDIAVAVVKSGVKANAMAAGGGYLRSEFAESSESDNVFRPRARRASSTTGSAGTSGGSRQQQQNNNNHSNHSRPPAGSRSNEQSSSSNIGSTPSSGGSGQQPNNNKNNNGQGNQSLQSESHMSIFLQLFNANSLDDIAVGRPPICIFYQLADGQRRSLLKLIRDLRREGILEQVVETVRRLFDEMDCDDISFQNFLSLANIVSTYIGERVAEQIATVRVPRPLTREQFNELRKELAQGVKPNNIVNKIFGIIQSLKSKLTSSTIKPYFRNVLAAIYHYYKHRIVAHLGIILTPEKYKELIEMLLADLKTLSEYEELQNTQHSRREVEFERYFIEFLRRVRLVVKIQDNNEELSTLYVLDDPCDDEDKDGDEFVDKKKIE